MYTSIKYVKGSQKKAILKPSILSLMMMLPGESWIASEKVNSIHKRNLSYFRARIILPHFWSGTTTRKHKYQVRLFTEGALKAAGLWIVDGKTRVSSVSNGCITWHTIHALPHAQMFDASPVYHLCTEFGPWTASSHHPRGGLVQSKWWTAWLTYKSVRAVDTDVTKSLNVSSCLHAFHQYLPYYMPSQTDLFWGTNWISAFNYLKIEDRQHICGKVPVR